MSNSEPRGTLAAALGAALSVSLWVACGSAGSPPADDARPQAGAEEVAAEGEDAAVPFETMDQTQQSAIEEQRMEAILDAEALALVWPLLRAEGPPPEIDFDREMAILAATGTRANTCYRVEIASIAADGSGGLAVEVADVVPGEDCMCGMAITYPAQLVRLARHDGPVSFTVVRKPHDCS